MFKKFQDLKLQIALLVVFFIIFGAFSLQFHAFAADEYTYMNNALAFATGDLEKANDLGRFPVFSFLLSIGYKLIGDSEATGRILNVLLGFAAALAVLFLVYWSEKDKGLAFTAAILTASNPVLLFLESRTFSEPLFIFLLILSMWALLQAAKNEKFYLLLGPLVIFTILTRFFGLFLLPIGALYLWKKNKLVQALRSKYFYAGILIALILPVLVLPNFGLNTIDTQAENIAQFINNQIVGNLEIATGKISAGMGLPDKIPSYLLTLPFLLGAPMLVIALLLLFGFINSRQIVEQLKQNNLVQISAVTAIVVLVVMELHGFIAPRLLRYAAVVIPFLAIIFSLYFMKIAREVKQKELLKKVFWLCILFNLITGFVLVGYFGTYEKHVAFREGALYASENCDSYKSNIEYVLLYYTGQKNSENPRCFVLNNYDGLTVSPPDGYQQVFNYGKVTVYKK